MNQRRVGRRRRRGQPPRLRADLDEAYCPNPSVHTARLGDDLVLLDSRQNRWHILNRSAAQVWTAIDEGIPMTKVVDDMSERTGICQSVIARDIGTVLDGWLSDHLIDTRHLSDPAMDGGTPPVEPLCPPRGVGPATCVVGQAFLCLSWLLLRSTTIDRCVSVLQRAARRSTLPANTDRRFLEITEATRPRWLLRTSAFQCLETSLAAAIWCRLAGLPASWCVGATTRPFAAHAWVELSGRSADPSAGSYILVLRA